MHSSFEPMPDLISQEDNYLSRNNGNSGDNLAGIGQVNSNSTGDGRCGSKDGQSETLRKTEEEMSVETKTSSVTHFINWKIDNRSLHIAKLAPKGDKRGVIEANVEKENHRFKLELCASGWRNSQDGYCAFYLTVSDQDDLFVARYRVQVGEITRMSSIRHDFHLGVGFPNFCQQETLERIMADNFVKFQVTVEVFNCHSQVRTPPLSVGLQQKPEFLLSSLITDMYKHRLHADVHLVCQGLRIPVHKCMLAHASPVFRSMFSHNMLETTTKEVRMSEWDPATVLMMVEFLYTCRISSQEFDVNKIANACVDGCSISYGNGGLDCDDDFCSLELVGRSPSLSPAFTVNGGSILNGGSPRLSTFDSESEEQEFSRTEPRGIEHGDDKDSKDDENTEKMRRRRATAMTSDRNGASASTTATTTADVDRVEDRNDGSNDVAMTTMPRVSDEMKQTPNGSTFSSALIHKRPVVKGDLSDRNDSEEDKCNRKNQFASNLCFTDCWNDQLDKKENKQEEEEEEEAQGQGDERRSVDNTKGENYSCSLYRDSTFKLFQLAEYYKYQALVIACCEKMHEELTVQTACDLLIRIQKYAHVQEIRAIKDSIWKFVTANIREIKCSRGYENLVKNHSMLLGQLIDKMTI